MSDPEKKQYILGMIGLGTMGRNLLLNMADHKFQVAGYDKNPATILLLENEGKGTGVKGFSDLKEFIGSLQRPRAIMLLVPAGKIVDNVLDELIPVLEEGDMIIDAGNSHFTDTIIRVEKLKAAGLHFFGMGISGGEEGARYGPSMMPGGDMHAYATVKPILEAIAARVNNEPCVTYIGPGASGHFVKMVHNGIEYGLMQLIAETYEILKKGLNLDNEAIRGVFSKWNQGRLQSFLLEITADIFAFKDPTTQQPLVDLIKDEAKAKGTGKWTAQIAMDLEVSVPTIEMAVSMRDLSKHKKLRTEAAAIYNLPVGSLAATDPETFIAQLENAFYFSMMLTYAQGLHILSMGSTAYNYQLHLDDIAKIWRGGCIIRAKFLEDIYQAYHAEPGLAHLLLSPSVADQIKSSLPGARAVVSGAVSSGLAIPAYAATLSYFDTFRSERMPSNLIQAQRDYFGAHTYELIGKEGVFHTVWNDIPSVKPQQ